jgi:hypothetical protein
MKPPQLLINNGREIIIRVKLYVKRLEIILADFVTRGAVIVGGGWFHIESAQHAFVTTI